MGPERADDVLLLEDTGCLGVVGAVEGALDAAPDEAGAKRAFRADLDVLEQHRLDRVRRPAVDVLDAAEGDVDGKDGSPRSSSQSA